MNTVTRSDQVELLFGTEFAGTSGQETYTVAQTLSVGGGVCLPNRLTIRIQTHNRRLRESFCERERHAAHSATNVQHATARLLTSDNRRK